MEEINSVVTNLSRQQKFKKYDKTIPFRSRLRVSFCKCHHFIIKKRKGRDLKGVEYKKKIKRRNKEYNLSIFLVNLPKLHKDILTQLSSTATGVTDML